MADPAAPEPSFTFVSAPSALVGVPAGWSREMLREGTVALLGDEGLTAVNTIAHDLDQLTIALMRSEATQDAQDETVITHAGALPLIWVAADFSPRVSDWARDRGPMTLLVTATGPLPEGERRRIDRFVAILGRQSE
jgi:hypothetical protein